MEKLLIKSNGQWELKKNWTPEDHKKADRWIESSNHKYLKDLPRAEGKTRANMMGLLGEHAESRINPATKEKEYKLFRAGKTDDSKQHNKRMTSWTSSHSFTHYWAHILNPSRLTDPTSTARNFQVSHAWIPEKHVHSYLTEGTVNRPGLEEYDHPDEQEILVQPHDVKVHHVETGAELQNNVEKEFPNLKKTLIKSNGQWELKKNDEQNSPPKPLLN